MKLNEFKTMEAHYKVTYTDYRGIEIVQYCTYWYEVQNLLDRHIGAKWEILNA